MPSSLRSWVQFLIEDCFYSCLLAICTQGYHAIYINISYQQGWRVCKDDSVFYILFHSGCLNFIGLAFSFLFLLLLSSYSSLSLLFPSPPTLSPIFIGPISESMRQTAYIKDMIEEDKLFTLELLFWLITNCQ